MFTVVQLSRDYFKQEKCNEEEIWSHTPCLSDTISSTQPDFLYVNSGFLLQDQAPTTLIRDIRIGDRENRK